MDGEEFTQTSLEVAFQNRTIEFDPVIPSKEIACAMQCSEDPKCLAYDFDQKSSCALMTKIYHGKPGTTLKVFREVRGKSDTDYYYIQRFSTQITNQRRNILLALIFQFLCVTILAWSITAKQ